jgi:hypothetical protein
MEAAMTRPKVIFPEKKVPAKARLMVLSRDRKVVVIM